MTKYEKHTGALSSVCAGFLVCLKSLFLIALRLRISWLRIYYYRCNSQWGGICFSRQFAAELLGEEKLKYIAGTGLTGP
jgi:hypothetical protein